MKFQVWYWISVICYHLQHADLEREVVKRGVYRIKAKILNSVTVTNKKYLINALRKTEEKYNCKCYNNISFTCMKDL